MRFMLVPAFVLAAAAVCDGCSKASTPPSGVPQAISTGLQTQSAQDVAKVKVSSFVISPETATKGQPVTVQARFEDAPAHLSVTCAWFGPDGWLVGDDTRDLNGNAITFTMRGDAFHEPGRYRAELRSGNVSLAEASVDVKS